MTKVFQFTEVGYLGQSWGVEGGLKFKGMDEVFARILELGYLFVRLKDGSPVPYLLSGAEQKGEFVLYLEGIHQPEEARPLSGRPVLLEEQDVDEALAGMILEGSSALHKWRAYTIVDIRTNKRWKIHKIEQYPQQEMAVLEGDLLIPLHEDLIVEVDSSQQVLRMDLPEGLFEE